MAIQKYPRLLSISERKLLQILQLLRAEGITKDEILTYPDVFTHSLNSLRDRVAELRELGLSKIKLVSLRESHRVYHRKIEKFVSERDGEIPYQSKEELLEAYLQCERDEASRILNAHDLHASRLITLKAKLDLLLAHECPLEILLAKPWILRFPFEILDHRLQVLAARSLTFDNCDSVVHLLTCEEKFFTSRLAQHDTDRLILGECRSKSDYLMKRLECDEQTLSEMIRKNHKLLSTNLPKLKAHLDYILEELRLPAMDLRQFPRLFNFSVDTIKSRYSELSELGVAVTVRELALEKRSYDRFVGYWRPQKKR